MKTYTITASETVVYQTDIKAESYEKALDLFVGVDFVNLAPLCYEGFQIDSVEEDGCEVYNETTASV